MARCAACGSKSVAYGTKKEGFSVGKAVAGTIFFGPVGAVAGAAGKKTGYYHCGACGSDLGYCMSNFAEKDIDTALADPAHNEKTLLRYKQRYCNIEWNPSASAAASISADAPRDNCAAIISRIKSRKQLYHGNLKRFKSWECVGFQGNYASYREKSTLLYKYCLENQITSFDLQNKNLLVQLFGDIAEYLDMGESNWISISSNNIKHLCETAEAYGYISIDGDIAKVSQNKVDIANARTKFLRKKEIFIIQMSGLKDYVEGVMSEAFNGRDSMTPEELRYAIAQALLDDGISTDMQVIEELSYGMVFNIDRDYYPTQEMSNYIWDLDEPKDEEEYEEDEEYDEDDEDDYDESDDYIVKRENGILTRIRTAERTRGYEYVLKSYPAEKMSNARCEVKVEKSTSSDLCFDRTGLVKALDMLNLDLLYDKCKDICKKACYGDKELSEFELMDLLLAKYSFAFKFTSSSPVDVILELYYEGTLERDERKKNSSERTTSITSKAIYYTISGGFKRNKERKEREETAAFNSSIDAEISRLNSERAAQNQIYTEFRNKIFGEGARKKKAALARISEIDAQISSLNAKKRKV